MLTTCYDLDYENEDVVSKNYICNHIIQFLINKN